MSAFQGRAFCRFVFASREWLAPVDADNAFHADMTQNDGLSALIRSLETAGEHFRKDADDVESLFSHLFGFLGFQTHFEGKMLIPRGHPEQRTTKKRN